LNSIKNDCLALWNVDARKICRHIFPSECFDHFVFDINGFWKNEKRSSSFLIFPAFWSVIIDMVNISQMPPVIS